MAKTTPRILLDENLVSDIEIAGNMKPEESSHNRYVVATASLQWLVRELSTSKQFTSEQQAAFKTLHANITTYTQGKRVE
jgi:hypothetical protein